ncbi:TOTE conflict system archaeo-eukaryotic primase domain-containing protein, partial [Pseudoalteromonas fuliginea]
MSTFKSDIFPISNLLKNLFASNSNYHARQMPDGRYIKAKGTISSYEIRKMLFNQQSIAIYQRNRNTTVNWICYDFDIIKSVLGSKLQNEAEAHIVELVNSFCAFLDNKNVEYLLEFSGNRGFHVWLLFDTSISYKNAHQILKTILNSSNIDTNWGLVDIDLFPSTANVSGKYGKGVKIPLSKHQKSQNYSYLLNEKIIDYNSLHKSSLSDEFISEQTSILESHKRNHITELELIFDIEELEFEPEDTYYKIRKVFTASKSISANKLINHWKNNNEFKVLAELVEKDKCSHEVRKLITGILANLTNDNGDNIGKNPGQEHEKSLCVQYLFKVGCTAHSFFLFCGHA